MCLSELLQLRKHTKKDEMRRPTCSRCLNLTAGHQGVFLRVRSAAINLIKPPSGVMCVRCKLGDAEMTVIIRHCFGDQSCHLHTCDMNLNSTGNSQNDRTKNAALKLPSSNRFELQPCVQKHQTSEIPVDEGSPSPRSW